MICQYLNIMFLALLLSFSVHAGRDHAPLFGPRQKPTNTDKLLHKLGVDRQDYTHHVSAAEDYKDQYFRDPNTGLISLKKTEAFLEKLQSQYFAFKNRAYETKFLEQLDVAKTSAKKAQNEAVKPHNSKNVLAPFELYLIPKIEAIIRAVEAHADNEYTEGLLDDFIRGYMPYYNPNPFNARYANKVNLTGGIYHVAKRQERKIQTDKVQANNLLIKTADQQFEINAILKRQNRNVDVGSFLTNEDINVLLGDGYDISKLDPGESAFWEPLTAEEKRKIFFRDTKMFPGKNTKIHFDRVLYGGSNSPKVRIKFKNKYGVYVPAKLKIGVEVASELASGALMRLLGFNADKMIYTGTVNIYLKDRSFESFEAELRQKFGQYQNIRYNYERGVDSHGERFITWRDTLVEARPEEELRIGPLDIASWDLQNRREYRGSLLTLAWAGINDMKMDNKKVLLVKRGKKWVPQHRIHDTGIALGSTFTLNGLDSILSLPIAYAKVNQFETEITKKVKGGVEIIWNDFCFQYRQYGAATYYDHKWMARKIAALSKNDIAEAVIKSGLPPDMAHLFIVKLLMRRNNIVRSYELENEFALFEAPDDIKKYSPKAYPDIKNGTINKTAYEEKNIIPIRIRTWGSLVSSLLSMQMPFGNFSQNVFSSNGHTATGSLSGGAVQFDYKWDKEGIKVGPLGKMYLRPGVTIIPFRQVLESPQNLNTVRRGRDGLPKKNADGSYVRTNLPYMVVDQIKIMVAVGLGSESSSVLPVSAGGSVNILQYNITHRHFAESIKEAWLSTFKIPKILIDGRKQYAARYLGDLETIESYFSVGLNASFQVAQNWASTIAENGVGVSFNAQKIGNKLLYRDPYGRLHYVKEHVKKASIKTFFDFLYGNLTAIDYAGIGINLSYQKMAGDIEDIIIGHNDPVALQTNDHLPLNEEQAEREIKAFDDLKYDREHAQVMLNFSRQAQTANAQKGLNLLFVVSQTNKKEWGEIYDTLINGQTRQLFHASTYSGKYIGRKPLLGGTEVTDITVFFGKSKKTILEVEKRAPEKFTILVSNRVYARRTGYEGLSNMIKKLNSRYSQDPTADIKHQFFADLHIPKETEQNKYRKIYADMRTLVDGEYLLNHVQNISEQDVKSMLEDFFREEAINIRKASWNFNDDGECILSEEGNGKKDKLANNMFQINKTIKIIARFNSLKKELAAEQINWQEVWLYSKDLVHELFSKYYGVHILRKFLNLQHSNPDEKDKGLLVYGEIRNIGDHIETLERPHGHHANMRETGSHWGGYIFGKDKVRPIQYYMKFEDPTNQLPIYWAFSLKTDQILGVLEQGQPPNFSGEGI